MKEFTLCEAIARKPYRLGQNSKILDPKRTRSCYKINSIEQDKLLI